MSKYRTQGITDAELAKLPKAVADEIRELRKDSENYADDLHSVFAANDADLADIAEKHLKAEKAKPAPAPKADKPAKAKADKTAKAKADKGKPTVSKQQLAQLKAKRLAMVSDAEKEMAGIADTEYSKVLAIAKRFNSMRPMASQIVDGKVDHKNRLTPTPENLIRWMKNPGKFDLIGIDTFKENDPTADLRISREVFWHRIGIRKK